MYEVEIHKGSRVIIKEIKELSEAVKYLVSFREDKTVSLGFVTDMKTRDLEAKLKKGIIVTEELN